MQMTLCHPLLLYVEREHNESMTQITIKSTIGRCRCLQFFVFKMSILKKNTSKNCFWSKWHEKVKLTKIGPKGKKICESLSNLPRSDHKPVDGDDFPWMPIP